MLMSSFFSLFSPLCVFFPRMTVTSFMLGSMRINVINYFDDDDENEDWELGEE